MFSHMILSGLGVAIIYKNLFSLPFFILIIILKIINKINAAFNSNYVKKLGKQFKRKLSVGNVYRAYIAIYCCYYVRNVTHAYLTLNLF